MDYRCLGGTADEISLLGFGCMRFPLLEGGEEIDEPAAREMLEYALENGVNYFDAGYQYHRGRAEDFTGRVLAEHPEKQRYIATKMPPWLVSSEDDVERIFMEQLERLRVDKIDYYLVHNVNEEHAGVARKWKIFEKLLRYKEQGLVGRLGMSFHDTPDVLSRCIKEFPVEFVYIQLNYMDWELQNAAGQYEVLRQAGLPIFVMEPLRGSALATLNDSATAVLKREAPGASVASWGVRYAASLPGVTCVLSGMSSLEQVQDNLRTLSSFQPLTQQERSALDKALAIYQASGAIPCTSCRYCEDCPVGLDIAKLFLAYNQYMLTGSRMKFDVTCELLREKAYAKDCASCGSCIKACPQKIDIPGWMEKIAALIDQPEEA